MQSFVNFESVISDCVDAYIVDCLLNVQRSFRNAAMHKMHISGIS
jgi:hypothetical protein